ncbi:MAG: hypothetical protein A2Y60_05635 [Chloroflexi bacterium RBG_13_54_9]|nr:MAG: hypothetical protein A2Y60_05635 [Chloroflexi bacterium RBG_13_54_9]
MDPIELAKCVKEYAMAKVGFDLVGVASASDPQFDIAPQGHKPTEWLSDARSVVVGGKKVLAEILQTTPSPIYSKHYDQLNEWLNEAGYQLSRFLQELGYKAMWFPESDPYTYFVEQRRAGMEAYSPSFCHIHSAVAAGLGVRGKVGVVLTPQFGPRQRWMTVITTAPLAPDPKFEEELCLERIAPGSCGDQCVEICKTQGSAALRPWPEEGGVDMYKCNWGRSKARGLSCGMCISVCPVGIE